MNGLGNRASVSMDPFEQKVEALLVKKVAEAAAVVAAFREREKDGEVGSGAGASRSGDGEGGGAAAVDDERLPYNIAKHVAYIKQDAYMKEKKSLKKQSDIV